VVASLDEKRLKTITKLTDGPHTLTSDTLDTDTPGNPT
jgi:hypothetical protein